MNKDRLEAIKSKAAEGADMVQGSAESLNNNVNQAAINVRQAAPGQSSQPGQFASQQPKVASRPQTQNSQQSASGSGKVPNSDKPKKRVSRKSALGIGVITGVALVALIVSVVVNIALFRDQKKLEDEVSDLKTVQGQQKLAEQEVSSIVDAIGKHMLLPADETPAIATVTDAEALKKEQPFFKDANNDDRIVIYAKAERAILYRPSEDKIINVGPYIQQTDEQPAGTEKDEQDQTQNQGQ